MLTAPVSPWVVVLSMPSHLASFVGAIRYLIVQTIPVNIHDGQHKGEYV